MEFHEKLVLLRRGRNMTQTDLAETLGVTRQSVYKWEAGASYPEAMTLFAIKGLFGVSVDALLDRNVIISLSAPEPVVTREGETEEVSGCPRVVVSASDVYGEVPENPVVFEDHEGAEAQPLTPPEDRSALPREETAETSTEEPTATTVTSASSGETTEKKKRRGFFSRLFKQN